MSNSKLIYLTITWADSYNDDPEPNIYNISTRAPSWYGIGFLN
jgi:hypothetical protein